MKIANAPCSWGILEFGMEGQTDNYEKVLNEIEQTGYSGTELGDWGFMPTDPDKLKKDLASRNLNLVGAFVPVNFLDKKNHLEGIETAIKIAKLLKVVDPEHAKIVLSDDNGRNKNRTRLAGRIKPEHGLSNDLRKLFNSRIEELSKKVYQESGVFTVFHHHCAGFVETPNEIESLLEQTDPDLVKLCFDTGHYAFGGGDPIKGIKTFSERIDHIHFKDWDQSIFEKTLAHNWDYFESVGNGIFCELGNGSIDFASIVKELHHQNYSDWIVVEQDILPGMGSPKESAKQNREFLQSIGI